jgi:hypothetical protein
MPYITQEKRALFDGIVNTLHQALIDAELDDQTNNNTEGNVNYIVTLLLQKVYGDCDNTNYSCINDAIGELECIKQEFYRRVAAPYEDRKIAQNGDVDRNVGSSEPTILPIEIVVLHSA